MFGGDEMHRLTSTWWGRSMVCLSADQSAESPPGEQWNRRGTVEAREGRSEILTWKWTLEYPDQLWNHVETRECR